MADDHGGQLGDDDDGGARGHEVEQNFPHGLVEPRRDENLRNRPQAESESEELCAVRVLRRQNQRAPQQDERQIRHGVVLQRAGQRRAGPPGKIARVGAPRERNAGQPDQEAEREIQLPEYRIAPRHRDGVPYKEAERQARQDHGKSRYRPGICEISQEGNLRTLRSGRVDVGRHGAIS